MYDIHYRSSRRNSMVKFRYLVLMLSFFLVSLNACTTKLNDSPAPAEKNQNWVLFTLDTLRQDYLGMYGNPTVKTPALDKFSKSCMLFMSGISESNWTIPTHASLMTSKYPGTHGAIFTHRNLTSNVETAAEILSKMDFLCGASVAAKPTSSKRGFNQGFHFFDDENIKPPRLGQVVSNNAIAWLKNRDKSKRLFFWGHFFDPHAPYDPPTPYNSMYAPFEPNDFDEFYKWDQDQTTLDRKKTRKFIHKNKSNITVPILERALSMYMGEISYLDREISKLFQFMKLHGLFETSIITFNADHGEYFGEKGHYFRHAVDLGQPLIVIPYMIKIPSIPQAQIIKEPVQLVDLLPTVLSFLNIDYSANKFHGKNLKPIIMSGKSLENKYAFSEFHFTRNRDYYAVQDSSFKYVEYHRKNMMFPYLYDISSGYEAENLVKEKPELAAQYKSILETWRAGLEPIEKDNFQETEQMKKNLEALGYLDEEE